MSFLSQLQTSDAALNWISQPFLHHCAQDGKEHNHVTNNKHMPSSLLFPKWGSITTGMEVTEAQTMICEGTKWHSTHQSVNSGSLFHPQEVNKAFSSSTRDLEPFL